VTLNAEKLAILIEILKKDDETVVESGEFSAAEIAANLRNNVVLYGLSKLLQDRTSETEVGVGKIAAIQLVMDQFKAGNWVAERKSGSPVVSAEVEALAEIKEISVAEAQAALKKYDVEIRKQILANPVIVAKAEQIRSARKSAEGISLDELLPAA
jgi:hypothetical protein